MRFPSAIRRDPDIEAWMDANSDELGAIAKYWFDVMRGCGDEVRELLHDGHPTFRAHVNVGFFRGAELPDPDNLLEGTGKFMRHVKLGPGREVDASALVTLIRTAYKDMKERLDAA